MPKMQFIFGLSTVQSTKFDTFWTIQSQRNALQRQKFWKLMGLLLILDKFFNNPPINFASCTPEIFLGVCARCTPQHPLSPWIHAWLPLSYALIPSDFTLTCIDSLDFAFYTLISPDFTPRHKAWFLFLYLDFTSYALISLEVSHRVNWFHRTSHHMTWFHKTSHRIYIDFTWIHIVYIEFTSLHIV